MLNLKVGDKVVRKTDGLRGGEISKFQGEVKEITDEHIICIVYVDVPRTMEFNRSDGVDIHGIEYGWIEPAKQIDSNVT